MKITASSDSLRTLAVDAIAVIVYEGRTNGRFDLRQKSTG